MPKMSTRIMAGVSGLWQRPDPRLEQAGRIVGGMVMDNRTGEGDRTFLEKTDKGYDLFIPHFTALESVKGDPQANFETLEAAIAGLEAATNALKDGRPRGLRDRFHTIFIPDHPAKDDGVTVSLAWTKKELRRRETSSGKVSQLGFDI